VPTNLCNRNEPTTWALSSKYLNIGYTYFKRGALPSSVVNDTNRQSSILIDITISFAYLVYPNDFLLFINY
jgi:hypothetical protein